MITPAQNGSTTSPMEIFRTAIAVLTSLLVAACSMQTGPNSVGFSLDKASLLGSELSTFKLPDGSSGSLRVYSTQRGQEFSIKLEKYLKVIELGVAERMKVLRVEQIEDRTVLVLSRTEPTCTTALVLSLKEREVLNWTVTHPECHTDPEVQVEGVRLYLVYPYVRFAYQGGNLTKEVLPVQRPALLVTPPSGSRPAAGAHAKPATPSLGSASSERLPAKQPTRPHLRTTPAPAAAGNKPQEASQQSQKPIRIILD